MKTSELLLALVHAGRTYNRNKVREITDVLAERGFTFADANPDFDNTTQNGPKRLEEEAA